MSDELLFLFAPGAGAPSSSPWMRAWQTRLEILGAVTSFDYLYQQEGRRAPDRLPKLLATHEKALESARESHSGPVVLAGKSMGSRVGCHLAVETQAKPLALVCFGYPLRSPRGQLRDQVLLALRTPILFLQGSRDPLCPLDLLADVRARMQAPSELHVVDGGDHSLLVRQMDLRRQGRTQQDVDAEVLEVIRNFLRSLRPNSASRRARS